MEAELHVVARARPRAVRLPAGGQDDVVVVRLPDGDKLLRADNALRRVFLAPHRRYGRPYNLRSGGRARHLATVCVHVDVVNAAVVRDPESLTRETK